jgi:hypothetical protein
MIVRTSSKFNGSYRTPFKLLLSGNFYMQSGTPFNQLIPHPIYGNNEGFGVQRGTATVPVGVRGSGLASPNVVDSIGSHRTPYHDEPRFGCLLPNQGR